MFNFVMQMILWAPLCVVLVSLFEYAAHRWPLHHPWFIRRTSLGADHLVHHKHYIKKFEGPEPPSAYDALWVRLLFGAAWSVPLMLPVGIWVSAPFAVSMVLSAVAHAGTWAWVHVQMHRPTCGWLVGSTWFKFIKSFHVTHHLKPRTNFAFLFSPVWDWTFGTYRKTISRK